MRIHLSEGLQRYASAAPEISAAGSTIGRLLEDADRRLPGLLLAVCDETGAIRPHVNVFLNGESVKGMSGLATPVSSNDEIHIIQAISGG